MSAYIWIDEIDPAEELRRIDTHICPECRDGKHQNCDGTAWCMVDDEPTTCSCNHERTT